MVLTAPRRTVPSSGKTYVGNRIGVDLDNGGRRPGRGLVDGGGRRQGPDLGPAPWLQRSELHSQALKSCGRARAGGVCKISGKFPRRFCVAAREDAAGGWLVVSTQGSFVLRSFAIDSGTGRLTRVRARDCLAGRDPTRLIGPHQIRGNGHYDLRDGELCANTKSKIKAAVSNLCIRFVSIL
jgi:hypothetical protein